MKGIIVPDEMPCEPAEATKLLTEYYNYQRYHEGLGNATPYDVYTRRHLKILQRRKEVKNETLKARRFYNRTAREQDNSL